MKKKFMVLILLVVFLLLSAFTILHNSKPIIFTKTTNLGKENVASLSINYDLNQNEKFKKLIMKQEESRNVKGSHFYEWDKGIEVGVNQSGQLTSVLIHNGHFKTAKGIQIGDSKKAIIKAYGLNFYQRSEQGASIIGYVDKKRQATLEFWLTDHKVDQIKLENIFKK